MAQENRRRSYVLFILPALLLAHVAACASAAGVADPAGDFPDPDITALSCDVRGGVLYVRLDLARDPAGSYGGAVFIDADRNLSTGYREGTGADYVYAFSIMPIVYAEPVVSATLNDEPVSEATLSCSANRVDIAVPLEIPESGDAAPDLFAAVYTGTMEALAFDRAPDYGVMNAGSGEVKVPDGAARVSSKLDDRAGDAPSGDVTVLSTDVHDGVLDILVTYGTAVESGGGYPGGDLKGWVLIDADQNLATGFMNAEEAPPSFGIDYRLDYTIGPTLGTGVSLEKTSPGFAEGGYAETVGVPLGVPYNDAMFLAAGNQVFFRIPLALLGPDDGRTSIILDSFSLDELTTSGASDQVPDAGVGALDSGTGEVRPLLSYTGAGPVQTADRVGDSAGFGYDGDDIASVETGYAGNVFLVKVTYASLEPDDGAVTTVFFDTDQAADGLFESALVYSLYNGRLGAVLVGDTGGVFGAKSARHLVTMQGDSIFASVPLELLSDDGRMNLAVETALVLSSAEIPLTDQVREWMSSGYETKFGTGEVHINPDKFNRTLYDRVPETGFISVKP
ncbi:hypothetical protein [Methanoculleus sp. UBA303]|jgi:hypothetical protein|uniref:hypothetical protein n=1 Tax=Methanoculleus sp. UBA303 TaxID=1915497 RepID=UPI0025E61718|nr:hypothetical protein [Methanoculleus sp. UBA303]MDD3934637.1 hypothetical protein [Methanoculleus sp.]